MPTGESLCWQIAQQAQYKAGLARARRARRPRTPCANGSPAPATLSPSQQQGRAAEARAARHVRAAGGTVLARNLRCTLGEIDLVALDHGTLAFIEVRYRASSRHGGAAASVNREKQRRLVRAARVFLPRIAARHFGGVLPACRFDVIALNRHEIAWFKHAFT